MTLRTQAMQKQFDREFEHRRRESRECGRCGALRLYGHGCAHCGAVIMDLSEFADAVKIASETPEWQDAVKKGRAETR